MCRIARANWIALKLLTVEQLGDPSRARPSRSMRSRTGGRAGHVWPKRDPMTQCTVSDGVFVRCNQNDASNEGARSRLDRGMNGGTMRGKDASRRSPRPGAPSPLYMEGSDNYGPEISEGVGFSGVLSSISERIHDRRK